MAPIGSVHASKVDRLSSLVAHLAAGGQVIAAVQRPLRLGPHDEPQPDLMLLRPRVDFYEGHHNSWRSGSAIEVVWA